MPLIAHWSGKIRAGTETDHISAFCDVLPTLCDLAGIDKPENIDGISFLPVLLGEGVQEEHAFLYWEFPASGGQQAVRMGKWKGIRKNIFKDSLQVQLYDLEEDIREEDDVSALHPDMVRKMEDIFRQEHIRAKNDQFRIPQLGD